MSELESATKDCLTALGIAARNNPTFTIGEILVRAVGGLPEHLRTITDKDLTRALMALQAITGMGVTKD